MKIESFDLTDFKPIVRLQVQNLGSTVVIAGANGSGKTRLKDAIVQTLQGSPCMDMTITATRSEERSSKYFNGDQISVKNGQPNRTLQNYFREGLNNPILGGTRSVAVRRSGYEGLSER